MDIILLLASTLLAFGAIVAIVTDWSAERRLRQQGDRTILFNRALLLVMDDRLAALEGTP